MNLSKKAKKAKADFMKKYGTVPQPGESDTITCCRAALNADVSAALAHLTGSAEGEFAKKYAEREYNKLIALYDDFRNSPPVMGPEE